MIPVRHLLSCLAMIGAWALPMQIGAQALAKNTVSTERVRAELMAHSPQGVSPGKTVWVGLQLTHAPEWHTYWKNSGDSGLPTQLQWTLPAGVSAGEIGWPVPRKIRIGPLANYGYEGTVLLPVPLTITTEFKPSLLDAQMQVKLKASWLVCKQECIPEDGEFTLKVPTQSTTALNAAAFEAAFAAQPRALQAAAGQANPESVARIEGNAIHLSVQGLPSSLQGRTLEFFPETPEVIETAGAWSQAWNGALWTAKIPLSAHRAASPQLMPVVLASGSQGYRAELPVQGQWPAIAAPAGVSPALEAALRSSAAANAPAAPSLTLVAALLGALLGGLILNLMPCVFPILAIKVVGFTHHADDVRGHRLAGLAYTAGVMLSFAALGALMLGLRAAGEQLGWGFQLQSPAVVAVLAALFTVIGLNLAGVFEFRHVLPSRLATAQARHPVANSFVSGMLAVAVASPCTAPFMGASLGLAVALPAAQALLVFLAIGLGMALPYLAASWVPAIGRMLPRPGAWMDTFRKFMAFPMFATVVWLVWVLGQQSGIDGAGALLALLVAMSMVIWAFTLRGSSRRLVASISLALFVLLAWATAANITHSSPQQTAQRDGEVWQNWSSARTEQLVAAGQPVFVDFTAAWCVTCQYNKKTTLSDRAVLNDLKAKNVALLRADWTRRDPAITAALAQLGRNGVPVYVLYKSGRTPVVMSEILGTQELRSAIARL